MTASEIASEIRTLRSSMAALEAARIEYVSRRDRTLVVEPRRFSQHAVDAIRHEITVVDRQIVDAQERIAALEGQLPSAEETRQATIEADAFLDQARTAGAAFAATWTEFLMQIEAADRAARAVAASRAQAQLAIWNVRDLVDRFALNLSVPTMPEADRNEMKIAGLMGLIIRDVGYCQVVDDTADRELNAARARRAPATS